MFLVGRLAQWLARLVYTNMLGCRPCGDHTELMVLPRRDLVLKSQVLAGVVAQLVERLVRNEVLKRSAIGQA